MNSLHIGADKHFEIDFSSNFLLIDDGPIIDTLTIPSRRAVTLFDPPCEYNLNPLQGMGYKRARDFISILDAIFPEGANTLTKKNSNFVLLNALLDNPASLKKLVRPDKTDPAQQDAYQKIQTLLLSPVLRSVLTKPTNFPLDKVVLARLDRAVLGDFDAFVLAQFLISQFKGQVIIPDGGFYLREHHVSLIRQDRLTVGLNTLDEVSRTLRQALLLIPSRTGSRTTFEDAEVLAKYAGLIPNTNEHTTFIQECMDGSNPIPEP